MNDINYGHNQLTSSSCAIDAGRETISSRASALAAAKAVHHQQIALLVKESLSSSVVEPCLSPLLWSESLRMRLDG